MKILYIGDVMGKPGRSIVREILPALKTEKEIDFVIAQSENVSHGKSITPAHMEELMSYGVDFFTGGNHSFDREPTLPYLEDTKKPIVGPANMSTDYPGPGWKVWSVADKQVLVVSLLGSIFPNPLDTTNPLTRIDEIISANPDVDEIVVNIHCDFSSEKMMMGHYLDGRASLVVGDHWHVPTADARILPKGTAYVTDVGMCGSLESSLGITFEATIPRWRDGAHTKQDMAEARPWQFNAVLLESESKEFEQIRIIRE